MKGTALIRHFRKHNCNLIREGRKHSWCGNPVRNTKSAVPRHNEIDNQLAKKICRDLGIPNMGI